ncbi:MAG: TylF/MycF/NovP-related O-methyltransferase [Gammaproteobacteria bacterium]
MLQRVNEIVRRISHHRSENRFLSALSDEDQDLIQRLRAKNLTYLSGSKLAKLATACRSIEDARMPGLFLEAGCALGGSSILMASLKNAERPFFIYDVFGMIPAPTADDTPDVHDRYRTIVEGKSVGIGKDPYYGYEKNLYETVQSNLANFGIACDRQSVSLVKGLLQDTLNIKQPVALAHVDVDWYDPVKTCLERIFPHLVVGGSIILDDYHDWGGCRKATDEYLRTVVGQFTLDDSAGSMRVTKTR